MKQIRLSLPFPWSVLFFLTATVVYTYSFMEWIFFITKPSFMSGMSIWIQIRIFLLSALGLAVLPVLIILLLAIVDRLLANANISQVLLALGVLVPALIVSSLILILLDNFTYTVFKYGIVSTERIPRAGYGLLFLAFCSIAFYRIRLYVLARGRKKYPVKRNQSMALSAVLSLSVLLSLFSLITNRAQRLSEMALSQGKTLPNIILLGSDGLDANHLSVYGYERDTTPNMKRLSSSALVAENDFPNGGTTAGSVASILTGKLPIETRVIYPPDILQGESSYQHLPGILKRLGYHTVDLSVSYFGDALTLNMQGGFNTANERSGNDTLVIKIARLLGGGDSAYFVSTILQRLSDRVLHIFFLKPMTNPYETVIKPAKREDEQKRFNALINTLEGAKAPVFVHVHMLGTHGPRFEIRQQIFSTNQSQNQDWMMDFYDDAIVNFDQYVGQLFDYLSKSGKLDNTIVAVYSDHGRMWNMHQRVPLLFWFPHGEHAGTVQVNVQNLDIAPTILDSMGLTIPDWMQGQSILRQDLAAPAYIFSASVDSNQIEVTKEGLWTWNTEQQSPPFYQLGYVAVVACDQWFELYVQNPHLLYGRVKSHTYSCDSGTQLTPERAEGILLDHLKQNGYDVSSFPSSISMQPAE